MINALLHTKGEVLEITSDTWAADITRRGYQGFIFDCDGTLVDSADVHFQAFHEAIAEQGHILDRDWYLARTGLDRISLFDAFAAHVAPLDIARACTRSIDLFIALSDRVAVIPETQRLVAALAQIGPMAVGTNAESSVAEASLQATGLRRYFDHIVAISDGLPAKPAPDIFLQAARLIGVTNSVLVIEDSTQGVAAAQAGGFDVVQLLA